VFGCLQKCQELLLRVAVCRKERLELCFELVLESLQGYRRAFERVGV